MPTKKEVYAQALSKLAKKAFPGTRIFDGSKNICLKTDQIEAIELSGYVLKALRKLDSDTLAVLGLCKV